MNGTIGYPACNPNVISVGAVLNNLSGVHPVTSLNGPKLDFLADGQAPNNVGSATSFAAPIVAAAFAIVQSAESRVRTVDEIKFALNFASPECVPTPQGCVNVVTRESAQEAADCLRMGVCRPNLPPVGVIDNSRYGPIFGDTETREVEVEVDFTVLGRNSVGAIFETQPEEDEISQETLDISAVALPQRISMLPTSRDVVIKFTGFAGDTSTTSNSFFITLNNTRIETTGSFRGEQEFSFVINRHRFRSTNNTIRISPNFSGRDWGLTNVTVDVQPVVELSVGEVDPNRYGAREDPKRLSGMRASFSLETVNSDYVFSVTGFDIDQANEVEVYLNGNSQGFLTRGATEQFSSEDTFVLRRSNLNVGENVIEFVNRSRFSIGQPSENWAVRNMLVQPALPDLVGISTTLRDRTLQRNVPFSIQVAVRNNGSGAAPATRLRYYISTDRDITRSDSEIASFPFASLTEGRTRSVINQLQTTLVNRNRFIGFCLDVVQAEQVRNNNCSLGISLRNTPDLTPIIMLLILDD